MTTSLPTIDPSLPEGTGMVLPPLRPRFATGTQVWFRSATITKQFWGVWNTAKLTLLEKGFVTRKEGDTWILDQWLAGKLVNGRLIEGFYRLTPVGEEILERAIREQATPPPKKATLQPVYRELPFDLEKLLRSYQTMASRQVYRAVRHGREEWGYPGAVDASEMGTGKSYVTLAAALATGRKVAVFCPPVGASGWKRAFAHFGAQPHFIESYEAVRGAWRPEIAKRNADGTFTWNNPNEILVIADECQALRYDSTLTYQCFAGLLRHGIPCIAASATIALSPTELRFAGRIIGLHQDGKDWERFLFQHGCKKENGNFVWDENIKHLRDIQSQLFPLRGCRILKQELGDQCPETEIQLLPIITSDAHSLDALHRKTEAEIDVFEHNGMDKHKVEQLRKSLTGNMHQRWELALAPVIAQRVREDVANGWSVPVFVNFTETRMRLNKLLGTTNGFYGGQSIKVRKHIEESFQAEKIHILISNLKAGGASVSLHDVNGIRQRRAYIFPSYEPIPFEQATGRVDRVGGLSKSEQFIPYLAGTRMAEMISKIRKKLNGLSTLNDGADASGSKF